MILQFQNTLKLFSKNSFTLVMSARTNFVKVTLSYGCAMMALCLIQS